MKHLIKLIISKFYILCKRYIRNYNELPINYFQKDSTSAFTEGSRTKKHNYSIVLTENSKLIVGENVTIKNAKIMVRDNSTFEIGDNCVIEDTDINIRQNGKVVLEPFVIFGKSDSVNSSIIIQQGDARFNHHSKFFAKLMVRFGGRFVFGEYAGIGYNSEIRCEEKIEIGKYALISYDVCIYDTNAHSLNEEDRRKQIQSSYPKGLSEKFKPETKPIQIKNNVWIGKGATLTKGATIGNNCIIGIRTNIGGLQMEDNTIAVGQKPKLLSRKKPNQ